MPGGRMSSWPAASASRKNRSLPCNAEMFGRTEGILCLALSLSGQYLKLPRNLGVEEAEKPPCI
jgi:hypothetical protein